MGEGGEDHDGIRDEVCEVDPIVTEHVSEELREWRRQARREEQGENHCLTRSRLRHPSLPPSRSTSASGPKFRTSWSTSPRTHDSGRLGICAWERRGPNGGAADELGDEER